MVEKRFKVLRFIGSLYKILGIILGVLAILSALGMCVFSFFGGAMMEGLAQEFSTDASGVGLLSGALGGIVFGLVVLISGCMGAAGTYAVGEVIYLFLTIEENTRASAELLRSR